MTKVHRQRGGGGRPISSDPFPQREPLRPAKSAEPRCVGFLSAKGRVCVRPAPGARIPPPLAAPQPAPGGEGVKEKKASGSSRPPPKLFGKFSKHFAPWSRKTSLEERKRRVRAELRAGAGREEEQQGKGVCWRGVVAMESRCLGCRSRQGSACVCKKQPLSRCRLSRSPSLREFLGE